MFRSKRNGIDTPPTSGNFHMKNDIPPVEELSSLLDRLKVFVDTSMREYIDSITPKHESKTSTTTSRRGSSVLDSLKKYRLRGKTDEIKDDDKSSSPPGEKKLDEVATENLTKLDISKGTTKESTTSSSQETPSDKEKTTTSAENNDDAFTTPNKKTTTTNTPIKKTNSSYRFGSKEPNARFVPIKDEQMALCIENIRRIAELVVIGERAAATIQSETIKLQTLNDNVTKDQAEMESIEKKLGESEKYASIFDLFFERNGLTMITDIISGKSFDLHTHIERRKQDLEGIIAYLQTTKDEPDEEKKLEKLDHIEYQLKALDELNEVEEYQDMILLPPLAITTQGFQSVSIMVQNVKRATSLFFILSNNHINQLIDFPLDEYHIAEKFKMASMKCLGSSNNASTFMSPRRFASSELAELTTTFVTFMKSLALRMNAETLQFFLTYPGGTSIEGDLEEIVSNDEGDDDPDHDENDERPLDEISSNKNVKKVTKEINRPVAVKTIPVEFPLYDRALEFCSAHHDSFVRVTAMNICLNTLRLTTVAPKLGEDDPEEVVNLESATGDSPDAVLHNAKALPMRERLAIAQFVCCPSRVEKLASPIFTKLAQLWGVLEEQFRDMEMASKAGTNSKSDSAADDDVSDVKKKANDKVARAREIARRQKFTSIFNDTSYNLQDELLLLEDLLRVGLTSFNEQTIEMMFATFIYPLLLQPLLLYFQRNPVTAEALFADTLNDHSIGREVKQSDTTATEGAIISAPAKSALFCLSAAFQFLSNPPLLRLLFAAVFHPLSPDASGETMIRAKADVACIGTDGKAALRIDPIDLDGKMILKNDRSTYSFGTVTGRKEVSGKRDSSIDTTGEACVFVLSPALMEILEFRGDDGGLVARSRHNPYRKAIFQSFTLSKEVSDLQVLAVIAVDSAVSVVDEKFLADILFGLDIKKYRDNLPNDERFNSFLLEPDLDDRGIGGPATKVGESRLSLGAPKGGKVGFDYMNEVISSFKSSLMNAVPAGKGVWRLDYDMVAAHALLACIRGNSDAIHRAARNIDSRCRQAAAFLADTPLTIDKFAHEQLQAAWQKISPKESTTRNDDLYYGAIMDMIVRGNNPSLLANFFWLKHDLTKGGEEVPIYVSISSVGSYNEVGARACSYTPLEDGAAETALKTAVWSTGAWLKLDALGSLLNTLANNSKEHVLQNQTLGGFVFNRSNDPIFPYPAERNTIYSAISSGIDNAMFGTISNDSDDGPDNIKPGTVLNLVGKMAFPCVCEVPPSSAPLFSEAGAKVVSQGITWQSLYLVLLGHDLILAEPEKRSSGEGRVVTNSRLEDLIIEKDPDDARSDTTARRMIVINYNTDLKPPGLFHFGKPPTPDEQGPFYKVRRWKSALDIWFEDSRALNLAYSKVEQKIAQAKAERGSNIRRYLSNTSIS